MPRSTTGGWRTSTVAATGTTQDPLAGRQAAGPWFSTAFGRDGLITALQTLWPDAVVLAGQDLAPVTFSPAPAART